MHAPRALPTRQHHKPPTTNHNITHHIPHHTPITPHRTAPHHTVQLRATPRRRHQLTQPTPTHSALLFYALPHKNWEKLASYTPNTSLRGRLLSCSDAFPFPFRGFFHYHAPLHLSRLEWSLTVKIGLKITTCWTN